MARSGFTDADVPDQSGKTFFVTGANTGLGFEASKVLARQGARVLLGCRNRTKAQDAMARIEAAHPAADVAIVDLDLGDLASVEAAAEQLRQEPRLHGLVNNAGIMMVPYAKTKDGSESQFGVNHLGHFALTGHLLPLLEKTRGARIVNTSSNAHKMGDFDWNDLAAEKQYSTTRRYGMSKLANLLFTFELTKRLKAAGSSVMAVTVHPGGAETDLGRHLAWMQRLAPLFRPFLNTAAQGAWPTLMGATWPDAEPNMYFGPSGIGQVKGPAKIVQGNAKSQDPELARKLWEVSEELTNVRYLS